MRYAQLLTRTLRRDPAEAETASHRLALRAGLVRQMAAGIFSFLPLGLRVVRKIEAVLREEMAAADCAEILMPVVQPAEPWRESGRWETWGPEMVRMVDRNGRDICVAVTHEEAVTALARELIQSYRQLPLSVFQIQTKFRDEPRSRGGLIRVREFVMKDAYSFHPDEAGLDAYYPRMFRAYERIFARVGLGDTVIAVSSGTGMMGGTEAHHDDAGIVWPVAVAPFHACIVVLGGKGSEGVSEAAERLACELESAGVEVLVDDRDDRAGVKFNDADLIGIPIRITVGSRGLEKGQVEIKRRDGSRKVDVPLTEAAACVKSELAELER